MPTKFRKTTEELLNLRCRFFLLPIAVCLLVILASCRPVAPTGEPVGETTSSPSQTPQPTAYSEQTATPSSIPASATPTVEPTSALGIEPERLHGLAIRFWHAGPVEAGNVLSELANVFNQTNQWGITVETAYQGTYDDQFHNVQSAIEAGAPPHLTESYIHQALAWEAAGGSGEEPLVDLNAYAEDPEWGLSESEREDFYPAFWEKDRLGEKRLGLPVQQTAQLIYYNVAWAQELGFSEPPGTPEQFREQACAAAQANRGDDNPDNDQTGGWIISTNYSAITGWIHSFGGEILRDGVEGYQFDTPQAEAALTFLRDLYDGGCAWLSESDPPENEFANRLGIFSPGSAAGIPFQAVAFDKAGRSDEWTVIPYPAAQGQPVLPTYGPSVQILKSTPEHQLAAWLFLKWLAAPENQARLSQASGLLPTRQSALEHIDLSAGAAPQWAAALELVPYARPEPAYVSWSTVRWAVSDAATQLFRYYFTVDQVPELVKLLDTTADDLHTGE